MRESTRMIVVLTAIAVSSALVLSVVYNYTSTIIEANLYREMEDSIAKVVPDAAGMNPISADDSGLSGADQERWNELDRVRLELFEVYDEAEEIIGWAFSTERVGYAGPVQVMVGMDKDQAVSGVLVMDHSETPGLGTLIEEESFRDQFVGKTTADDIAIGQDIDNITGATISAEAVADAVRLGLEKAVLALKGGS